MADQGLSLPGQPNYVPGLPANFRPQAFEGFTTLNTKVPRAAIGDMELAWCDGFQPLGNGTEESPNVLQTLFGTSAPIFTATGGKIVKWFGFGNIGSSIFLVVLLSDGSILDQNGTIIAPPLTILSPTSILGFSQWGSQYLIFAKDQTNGYWLWDGTNLFSAGTLGPTVTIDDAGSNYTSPPTVILQTTGVGTATLSAQISNGSVTQVTVTNPGSGFADDDFVGLNFTGGGSDNQCIANPLTPTLTSGGVSELLILNGGQSYTYRTSATFTGGGGTGAQASLTIQNGTITAAAIINPGSGYTSAPTFSVTDPGIPGTPSIPPGSGFSGACTIAFGQITSIIVTNGGTGYITPPTIDIIGDGTGAQAIALISGGAVSNVVISNMGTGYTKGLAIFKGGNNAANATPIAMPFGVSGTTVEVYQQHVWVSNGAAVSSNPPQNRTIFSSANSPVDFSTSGGAFASTDSFLRQGYFSLKQTNGFLYLIGDSSVNYISGVQTTTPAGGTVGSATTTFGNQNVDPQFGSPWPSSVQVFSRNIVFANSIGIHVSYGGAVTKASTPLDGFYGSVNSIFANGANFSSAVATINGIPVYMLLLPVIDVPTQQQVNKLLMWDGKKWFTSQQDRSLTYIATQEINSILQAWGTDGTNVFQMFVNPSTSFNKIAISKLFSGPAYWVTKTAQTLSGVLSTVTVDQPISISLDSEAGQGTGNAVVSVTPTSGQEVFGPLPVGQSGRMIGFTMQTTASNLQVLSLTASETVESPNV